VEQYYENVLYLRSAMTEPRTRSWPFSLFTRRGPALNRSTTGRNERQQGKGKRKERANRENRRKDRRRWLRRCGYIVLVLVVIALAGTIDRVWSVFTRYVTDHPYFSVKEVVVHADGRFLPTDLRAWSGVAPGMNLWRIEPTRVQTRLLTHREIHTARVWREFPQRVHITVSARQPVAIVRTGEGLVYVDDTGVCFPSREHEALDLPYISGLSAVPLDTATARTALVGALQRLSLARSWQEPVSEIHWDQEEGYTLFLEQHQVAVWLEWKTAAEQFAHVGKVLTQWPVDRPAVLFDARFDDQIVVQPPRQKDSHRAQGSARAL
jgi:cell division septal protein FtsQ